MLQQNSLREILVRRGVEFDALSGAAWRISLATGLLVAALTAAAGPFAARLYHAPGLVGLLGCRGGRRVFRVTPGRAGRAVADRDALPAPVRHHHGREPGLTALTLCFAGAGLGPYSLIAPLPIVQLCSLLYQCRATRGAARAGSGNAGWRSLLGASGLMLGAAALYAFNAQGASVILGLFKNVQTVGIFFSPAAFPPRSPG